jgi:hypothetical protein
MLFHNRILRLRIEQEAIDAPLRMLVASNGILHQVLILVAD